MKNLKAEYEAIKEEARKVNREGWIAEGKGNKALAEKLELDHTELVKKQNEAFKVYMMAEINAPWQI